MYAVYTKVCIYYVPRHFCNKQKDRREGVGTARRSFWGRLQETSPKVH